MFICSFQVYGMETLFRFAFLCRTFLSGVANVLNLRNDTLPSVSFLLCSVPVLSVSGPPVLGVNTVLKLSYKTFSRLL